MLKNNDNLKSLKGKILISTSNIAPGIFHKSVVLLTSCDDKKGAEGIILSLPTDKCIGDVLSIPQVSNMKKLPVFLGGPVESNKLIFTSIEIQGDKLHVSSHVSIEKADNQLQLQEAKIIPTVGYAGWSPGQLENELTHDSWYIINPDVSILELPFNNDLWRILLSDISPYHRLIANCPEGPSKN